MQITVNGESRRVPAGTTVAGLVSTLGLGAGRFAVEIDARIVPRSQHAERHLADGEVLEIVTFVGGG
ncbi:MAG: sulfur carrier protein ThiS [Planctomycetes bacterium]|nr:sulfur carrier protein ThiS [Planctomycetota bacterium]